MSPIEKPVPPAGEEIHLPGPSLQPLLMTIGITVLLLGVVDSIVLVIVGGLLTVAVLISWIRDTIRETNALPVHDDHH